MRAVIAENEKTIFVVDRVIHFFRSFFLVSNHWNHRKIPYIVESLPFCIIFSAFSILFASIFGSDENINVQTKLVSECACVREREIELERVVVANVSNLSGSVILLK